MFKDLTLDKTQIIIGIFTLVILIFMGVIFYQLTHFGKDEAPVTPQVKTKAAGKTYRKEIALNTVSSPTPSLQEPTPTEVLEAISPTETPSPEPTLITENIPSEAPEVSITPTPSDIIIAKTSPTESVVENTSPTPTGVKSLPRAGYFYYNLFLFAVGVFIIVFSLVI